MAPIRAEGYAVAQLEDLGTGPGFLKIRTPLGVSAFGVNAIELPPHHETSAHWHERQEELYFVHRGEIEFLFGDGSSHRLGPGGLARVDAATVRRLRNATGEPAVVLVIGGEGGYVGRDGHRAEPPSSAPPPAGE